MKLFILPIKEVYHEDDELVVMAESKEEAIRKIQESYPNKEKYIEQYGLEEHEGDVYYNGGCDC